MSRAQLQTAATALGQLNEQVVFLGGASVELWITDPTTRPPRVTYDVDVVIQDLLARPTMQHVVITGRGAPQELIDVADTVTDMTVVKHAFAAGIGAQAGIEW